jgi:calcineurin-like phosphoesterase
MFMARNGKQVVVINAMGRLYMDALDDPFAALERELAAAPLGEAADALVIDFHAEATSEKQAAGMFADGKASLVVGTHTHVPTADHRILAGGTAYMSDAGMCGDYDSILGMDREEPLRRFLTKIRGERLNAANGPGAISGVAVDTDDATGLAIAVAPLRTGPGLEETVPGFWG